jgi:hypothetical protein
MSEVTNEHILTAILGLKQDMGAVQATARNAHEYVGSVSKKADIIREEVQEVAKDLGAHKRDEGAHGISAAARGWGALQAGIGAVLGAIVAVIAILKFVAPLVKAAP